MKKNKIFSLAMASIMLGSTVATMASCGKKFGDDEQSFEVYALKTGHGVEWAEKALKAFSEKDEIKEKYPDLQYKLTTNSEADFGSTQVMSGGTTIDLVLAHGGYSPANMLKEYKKGQLYLESLEEVYNSKIPTYNGGYEKNAAGEEWTYATKMQAADITLYDSFGIEDENGDIVHYTTSTANGKYGIVYNKTKMNEYGYKDDATGETILPRTTNELIALADSIKSKNVGKKDAEKYYAFISSGETSYWAQGISKTFWAQYSGYDEYNNYFQGLWMNANGEYEVNVNVVDDQGKRESLRVVDRIMNYRNGYIHPDSAALGFTRAQALLLDGTALMQANGDWVAEELEYLRDDDTAEEAVNNEIRFMEDPLISALGTTLESIENDEEYSAVIGAIRAGETALQGSYKVPDYSGATATWKMVDYDITQSDYDRIAEATLVYSAGTTAGGIMIPSYATAKAVAKDFLVYLASDEFLKMYIEVTGGAGVPFYYDVQTKAPEMYDSFNPIQKDRIKMVDGKKSLPPILSANYKLVYLGGYANSTVHDMETYFYTKNDNQYKSADQICDEIVNDYTKNNNANWKYMLEQAKMG